MSTSLDHEKVNFQDYVNSAKKGLVPWDLFVSLMKDVCSSLPKSWQLNLVLLQELKRTIDKENDGSSVANSKFKIDAKPRSVLRKINPKETIEESNDNAMQIDHDDVKPGLLEPIVQISELPDSENRNREIEEEVARPEKVQLKIYGCMLCGVDYSSSKTLKKHLKQKHAENYEKTLKEKVSVKTIESRGYSCKGCGKSFTTKTR